MSHRHLSPPRAYLVGVDVEMNCKFIRVLLFFKQFFSSFPRSCIRKIVKTKKNKLLR